MSSAPGQPRKCLSLWIHCNRCFENYNDKQRKIYILSCYHVACEKCITIVNKNQIKCSICKNTIKSYPIGNDLPTNLKELFHPRPWSLSFVKTLAVLKFQTKQRNNFMIGCKKLKEFKKLLAAKRDRKKEECKQLYLQQEKLKKEKAKLTAGLKKLKEISLAKKYAYQSFEKNHSNDFKFGMQSINKRSDQTKIPYTCHMMSRSRNEDTFDFPAETSPSTSFYL